MNLRRLIIWSIIGTGISSVTTQLLTIREFLTQFNGNEITISLVIFTWLMITGIGAFVAQFLRVGGPRAYALLILIIALWPLVQMVGIRELKEIFFTHGLSPGFYSILLFILITSSPYCLLTGFILPYSQHVLHRAQYPFESGDLYVTDSIGDIAGGTIFSFHLVYWLKPFPIIAVTSSLLILIALLLLARQRPFFLLAAGLIASSLFYLFCLHHGFETSTLAQQYGRIVRYIESPYGRIVITREGPQYTFWESGRPLYSEAHITNAEEKVHYPLSQIAHPQDILLISGGLGQTLKEINKYGPAHVDYVELDPALTGAAEELGVIARSPALSILNTDARRHIRKTTRQYDAILMDLPDPDTFQLNRFFTDEFFSLAKGRLKKGGVLSLHLDYSPHYLSQLRKEKLSSLYNTARGRFQHVLIIPGDQAYFLMSDGELNADVPGLLTSKKIATSYIQGFFYGDVTQDRMKQLQGRLERHQPVNTDFRPGLMKIVVQEWFSRHGIHPGWFFATLLGLTLLYLVFLKKAEYVLFSTGFTIMGMEMLIIFVFQIIYGYIYLEIGAVVTAFLLGLLPGALAGQRWGSRPFLQIMASEAAILVLLLIFFLWASYGKIEPHPFHFLMFGFVFSLFAGFQFPLAARIIGEETSPAAGLLAADLCGAAVGALATGAVLIPLWGIGTAAMVLILVKISSMILSAWTRRTCL